MQSIRDWLTATYTLILKHLVRLSYLGTDCPILGTPVSGMKTGNRYDFGSTVRFECKEGYMLQGSSIRRCMPNGKWNGTEAKCIGKQSYKLYKTQSLKISCLNDQTIFSSGNKTWLIFYNPLQCINYRLLLLLCAFVPMTSRMSVTLPPNLKHYFVPDACNTHVCIDGYSRG